MQRAAAPTTVTADSPPPASAKPKQPAPALEPHSFAGPDLSGIPGARVITASERKRVGACARKP
jgi:hypothetical protein